MKVVLVDNLLLKNDEDWSQIYLQPHLGLISLVAVLEKAGHNVVLYDPKLDISKRSLQIDKTLYKNIARNILEQNPDVVGFTTLGCNFICTVKIANYIKVANHKLPIMLGGPHATVLHKEIISTFPQFDIIVKNESENKIVKVIENLHSDSLSAIRGITYRRSEQIVDNGNDEIIEDLETLPFPAYWSYPIDLLHLKTIRVEAGRGCPFKCTFCSTATFFGRSYRLKSPSKICNELDYISERYGISDFALTHDLFTVNRKKVILFCQEVKSRKYTWSCSARIDCVDEDLLTIMKEAGCRAIYFGIETGSARMQEITKKKLDLSLFDSIIDATLKLGMRATVSFIIGYPEESKEDLDLTLDSVGKCFFKSNNVTSQLHLLTPEPGTAMLKANSKEMMFDNYISDFNFPTLEDDDAELMSSHSDIFMNHHYFKTILDRKLYITTSSLFECLSVFGNIYIKYLLKEFKNSLHLLNDKVYMWIQKKELDHKITPKVFLAFIKDSFHTSSVMYSLTVYLIESHKLTRMNAVSKQWKEIDGVQYEIPGNIGMLSNVINSPLVLDYLQNQRKLPSKISTKKVNLILKAEKNNENEIIVRNFEIDHQTFRFLNSHDNTSRKIHPEIVSELLKSGLVEAKESA